MALFSSARVGQQVAAGVLSGAMRATGGIVHSASGGPLRGVLVGSTPLGAGGMARFYSSGTPEDLSDFQKRQMKQTEVAYNLNKQKVKQDKVAAEQTATADLLDQRDADANKRDAEFKANQEAMQKEKADLEAERLRLSIVQEDLTVKQNDVRRKMEAVKVLENLNNQERGNISDQWYRIAIDKMALQSQVMQYKGNEEAGKSAQAEASSKKIEKVETAHERKERYRSYYSYFKLSPVDYGIIAMSFLFFMDDDSGEETAVGSSGEDTVVGSSGQDSIDGVSGEGFDVRKVSNRAIASALLDVWLVDKLQKPLDVLNRALILAEKRQAEKRKAAKDRKA